MNEMEDLRQVAGYLVDIDEGYYARRVDKALRAWEADIQDKEIAGAAMDNLARKLTDAEAHIEALERRLEGAELRAAALRDAALDNWSALHLCGQGGPA
ncbi:MAG TPA: hypothetical protein VJM51_08560 [Dehalococcoidia bacterium]|nr:hypothetical protein [Dehalococcoidia bacterium]